MLRTTEGSTGRLVQLCAGYFVFYVITGIMVKYFTDPAALGFPGMQQLEYSIYNTIGGTFICLGTVLVLRWYHLHSNQIMQWGSLRLPREALYIIPSGVCTAVVIPTTTLMYTLPISVMVAMVIMRASIIIISRLVDAVQIKQGILKKTVYREENIAVIFALCAAGVNLVWVKPGDFDFLGSVAALSILGSYIVAYTIRIYIMNYYKNTRGKGVKQDNKGFFAIEQIAASFTLVIVGIVLFNAPRWFASSSSTILGFHDSLASPHPLWLWGVVSGMPFGIVAFFSVFLFMFKGRTATFTGLVNRLTSLVAGTTATLTSAVAFGDHYPKAQDWLSLVFILVAVGFLSVAERKRTKELAAAAD